MQILSDEDEEDELDDDEEDKLFVLDLFELFNGEKFDCRLTHD